MKISYFSILACLSMALLGCKTSKSLPTTNTLQETPQTNGTQEYIMFFVFQIKKDSPYSKIVLSQKNKVNGKIKIGDTHDHGSYENHIMIYQYNTLGALDSVKIEHPLYKHVEHFHDGEIHTQYVELDSAEFFIRMQLHKDAQSIKVIESTKQYRNKEICTIKL